MHFTERAARDSGLSPQGVKVSNYQQKHTKRPDGEELRMPVQNPILS